MHSAEPYLNQALYFPEIEFLQALSSWGCDKSGNFSFLAMEKEDQKHTASFVIGNTHFANPITNEIGRLEAERAIVLQRLEPKVMEVLVILAKNSGEVVPKAALTEAIWDGYGGAEDSLMQAISKLRKVLGDQAKAPLFIETIPKKGYRLLPQVDSLETSPSPEATPNTVYVYRTVGSFTDFIEKLTQPKFLLAFLVFSICLIMVLAILSYMVFWL